MEVNSESIDAALACAIMPLTPTLNVSLSCGPSAPITRTGARYFSSVEARPPISVLTIAATGSMLPALERPSPSPFFQPIFSSSAKPRPDSTGASLSFERQSLAARGTSAADLRTASMPMICRFLDAALAPLKATKACPSPPAP
eukprot:scaffold6732_cov99-Isochrysis_galbana.AAC.5